MNGRASGTAFTCGELGFASLPEPQHAETCETSTEKANAHRLRNGADCTGQRHGAARLVHLNRVGADGQRERVIRIAIAEVQNGGIERDGIAAGGAVHISAHESRERTTSGGRWRRKRNEHTEVTHPNRTGVISRIRHLERSQVDCAVTNLSSCALVGIGQNRARRRAILERGR